MVIRVGWLFLVVAVRAWALVAAAAGACLADHAEIVSRAEPEHCVKPAHASWAIASSVKRGADVLGWSEDAVHDRHRAAADDDATAVQFDADQT